MKPDHLDATAMLHDSGIRSFSRSRTRSTKLAERFVDSHRVQHGGRTQTAAEPASTDSTPSIPPPFCTLDTSFTTAFPHSHFNVINSTQNPNELVDFKVYGSEEVLEREQKSSAEGAPATKTKGNVPPVTMGYFPPFNMPPPQYSLPPLNYMGLQSRPPLFPSQLFPGIPGAAPPLLFPPGMFSNAQLPLFCSNPQPFQAGNLLQPNLPNLANLPNLSNMINLANLQNFPNLPAVQQFIQSGSAASSSTVATSPLTVGEGQQTPLNEDAWNRIHSMEKELESFKAQFANK